MDPKDLKRLLDALKDAEVKEFSLETKSKSMASRFAFASIHLPPVSLRTTSQLARS